jgi:16S rRNA (guanine(966)-N(2))-methyltransferase RsmD
MRVIAGVLKGRRLKTPSWAGLRPTSDRLRETLFDVLAPRIAGAHVLDGYAGTGAIGIEALSRGAASATFVDRDHRARALITENVEHCGIPSGCVIIRSAFDSSARPVRDGRKRSAPLTHDGTSFGPFDIVVLDPPYDRRPDQVIHEVAHLVAPAGVLVLEHAKRTAVPAAIASLVKTRNIIAGDSVLSFYEPG